MGSYCWNLIVSNEANCTILLSSDTKEEDLGICAATS
jgi:hypothetical protein